MGKKNKSKELLAVEEGHSTAPEVMTSEDIETAHKKKKKSKKNKEKFEADESVNVTAEKQNDSVIHSECADDNKDSSKNKKKKRKAEVLEQTVEEMSPTESKKKKRMSSENSVEQQDRAMNGAVSTEDAGKKKKKKVKKSGSESDVAAADDVVTASVENGLEATENSDGQKNVNVAAKKHKKKKKKNVEEEPDTSVCVDDNADSESRSSKKKKKDKYASVEEAACVENGASENASQQDSEPPKKKKKKKKDKQDGTESKTVETSDASEGDGGKKSKKHKNAELTSAPLEKDVNAKEKKKDKKKKKRETELEDSTTEEQTDGSQPVVSAQSAVNPFPPETPSAQSRGGRFRGEGTTFSDVQETNNNCNKEKSSSAPNKTLGQWNTTMFESSERQDKFLRLLGGFKKGSTTSPGGPAKKGLFGSLKPSASPAVGGQNALSIDQAKVMNQRLESDFERALNFRGQQGIGLGFQPDPAEGKKFHIDVSKTASKKFDD